MGSVRVIDSDGHVNIGLAGNKDQFAPSGWKERIYQFWKDQAVHLADLPSGGEKRDEHGEPRRGESDPHQRIPDMELEGIDTAVLVGGGAGEEFAGKDPGLAAALCQMYNDWLADYCGAYPNRLKALLKLPWIDPSLALAELQRMGRKSHVVGVLVTQHIREKNLDDPSLGPVYAEAERLGLPICVHGGGQARDQVPIGIDRFDTRLAKHAFTHPVGQMIATMNVACGGVMEQFPKLNFAFLEAGCGWVPWWIERLDEHYELMPEQAPLLKGKPSDYLLSGRAFFAAEGGEMMLPAVINAIGDQHVLYASDYCHWDCNFPDTVKAINQREDLSERSKKRILSENAARLYGL